MYHTQQSHQKSQIIGNEKKVYKRKIKCPKPGTQAYFSIDSDYYFRNVLHPKSTSTGSGKNIFAIVCFEEDYKIYLLKREINPRINYLVICITQKFHALILNREQRAFE